MLRLYRNRKKFEIYPVTNLVFLEVRVIIISGGMYTTGEVVSFIRDFFKICYL